MTSLELTRGKLDKSIPHAYLFLPLVQEGTGKEGLITPRAPLTVIVGPRSATRKSQLKEVAFGSIDEILEAGWRFDEA